MSANRSVGELGRALGEVVRGSGQIGVPDLTVVRTMLATVTDATPGALRVRPDTMTVGDIGPIPNISYYSPAVGDRVFCLWSPEFRQWVIIGLTNGAGGVNLDGTAGTGVGTSGVGSTGTLEIVLDLGGSALLAGVVVDIPADFKGEWVAWTLVAKESGSMVIDIWKDTYANFPPTVADTITGSDKPRLSSQVKNQSTALTGWIRAFAPGDILRVNIDSVSTITRATLGLKWRRT